MHKKKKSQTFIIRVAEKHKKKRESIVVDENKTKKVQNTSKS